MKTPIVETLTVYIRIDTSSYIPIALVEFLDRAGYNVQHSDTYIFKDKIGTYQCYKWCSIDDLTTLSEIGELMNLFNGRAVLKEYYTDESENSIDLEIEEGWLTEHDMWWF